MRGFDLIPYPEGYAREADLMLARTVQQWAETEVISRRLEYREDYDNLLAPAMHKLFVDLELQKLIWPENYGGLGYGLSEAPKTMVSALEQVGRADTGIGFLAAINFALGSSLIFSGSAKDELIDRIAPLYCQGNSITRSALVFPAFSQETPAKGDTMFRGKHLKVRARREGDNLVLSGDKLRPLNSGSDAHLFAVICSLEGSEAPALVLIPGDNPGLSRSKPFLKTGLAASVNAEINLTLAAVPVTNLLFQGEECLRQMLSWLYMNFTAVTVGSLLAAFEIIREWGDTRVIKGKGSQFKENPLTASLMAEISHEILISRLLLYHLTHLISRPERSQSSSEEGLFITTLSVVSHVTMAAEKAINQIMELMGSAGYATEWNLERYWRDVKTLQVHLGSWELNKMELARFFFNTQSL